jgi:hypothetical protein
VLSQLELIRTDQITDMDMADLDYYEISKVLGELIVEEIIKTQKKPFSGDLLNPKTGKDLLITRKGNVSEIQKNLSDPNWVNGLES